MVVDTLVKEEVLRIHNRLVLDFAESPDPISPPGVRSQALLESAIGRQHVAIGDRLKYPQVHENVATLLYGLCHDYPFHNGNKRTALVSMLAHLDKNRFTLVDVGRDELFQMIIDVATHSFWVKDSHKKAHKEPDKEVAEIAIWTRDHMYRFQRGERHITYHQLRRILAKFDYQLQNPKNNAIDVVKVERRVEGFFKRQEIEERK